MVNAEGSENCYSLCNSAKKKLQCTMKERILRFQVQALIIGEIVAAGIRRVLAGYTS